MNFFQSPQQLKQLKQPQQSQKQRSQSRSQSLKSLQAMKVLCGVSLLGLWVASAHQAFGAFEGSAFDALKEAKKLEEKATTLLLACMDLYVPSELPDPRMPEEVSQKWRTPAELEKIFSDSLAQAKALRTCAKSLRESVQDVVGGHPHGRPRSDFMMPKL